MKYLKIKNKIYAVHDWLVNHQWFITGSVLVDGVDHDDLDIVVYVDKQNTAIEMAKAFDSLQTSLEGDPRFISCRDGDVNYIFVWQTEMFWRFRGFSGALTLLQYADKNDRIALSKACLYDMAAEPILRTEWGLQVV